MPTRVESRKTLTGALAAVLAALLPLAGPAASTRAPGAGSWVQARWTVQDGLPVQSITDMLQSRDGYLWLATFDGLVRFDGDRFTVFDVGNSPGLPSSRILDLLETRDGSLWMITEQKHLVRRAGGRFQAFGPGDGTPARVEVMVEDAGGVLWVGGREGVSRVEDEGLVPLARDRIAGPVSALLPARDGTLWIGFETGLVVRYGNGEAGEIRDADGRTIRGRVLALFEAADGVIWVGSDYDAGLVSGETYVPLRLDGEPWRAGTGAFHQDGDGPLWLGGSRGFYRLADGRPPGLAAVLDGRSIGKRPMQVGPADETWFATERDLFCGPVRVFHSPDVITAYLFDHEGSVWLGTATGGLVQLKPGLFEVYGEPEGVAGDIIFPVLEDAGGDIWVGTLGGGVSRLGPDGVATYGVEDGVVSGIVWSLHLDRQGSIWVGTEWSGLCRIEGDRCARLVVPGLRGAAVRALHQDRDGWLWIGAAQRGLYGHRDGRWRHLTTADGLAHDSVRVIHESADGSLWLGTNGGGVTRMRDGAMETFSVETGLSSNLIRAIHEDGEGAFWIGTEGRGLNRLVLGEAGSTVTIYRKADGLFDDVIHQVLEDDHGRLWMSSNRGIFWVALQELRAFARGEADRILSTAYTERDGLRSREANGGMQPAGVKASDGRLWFPTQKGVVVVDPRRLRRNEAPPRLVIEEVFAGGRRVDWSGGGGPLVVDPHRRDLEIKYTALSFQEPANLRFRYRMEGVDRRWIEAGNRRVAYYTSVPPGEHTFRVVGMNNDGVWNLEGETLRLAVTPLLHEQAWFGPAVVLMVALMALAAYRQRMRVGELRRRDLESRVRTRTAELVRERDASRRASAEAGRQRQVAQRALAQVEAQARRLRDIDEAKSRFFANVTHEFRTPLTLTIGPLQDLRDGLRGAVPAAALQEIDVALRNSKRLLGLINEILEIARLEAGQVRPELDDRDLGELLRTAGQAFTALAERQGVALHVEVPEAPVIARVDAEMLEKVLTNLLANAFRHTPAGGAVRAALAAEAGGRARLKVSDSGPGIPADQLPLVFERFFRGDEGRVGAPSTGIGLALSKELVELHGGRIEARNGRSGGAVFTVVLPCAAPAAVTTPPGETAAAAVRPAAPAALPGETPEPATEQTAGGGGGGDDAGGDDVTTVLVIDDNPDLRGYVRRHLQPRYRVLEAADGQAGLEMCRRRLPDLVISDVMMPRLDGWALCRELRRDPELAFTPVILLTARAETKDRIEGLGLGADDYLTKPFDAAELRARVDNLIALRRRLRARLSREQAVRSEPVEAVSEDDRFLGRVRAAVEEGLGDEDFGVAHLAAALSMSRGHLHRRLTELLGRAPSGVIRSIRLERAAHLLGAQAGSVSEVAYAIGFKSVSHFCRCFREQFGHTPATHRKAGKGDP